MSESTERSDPRETIELQNVVASTGIEQELALESVAMDLRGADYDPENFPGVVYRTEEPRATTLLFRSGKMVSTGASSVEDVHTVLDGVFDDLRKLGIEIADEPEVIVQNMVASADLGQRLNLNAIAIGLGLKNVEYEPEQFPGLVYRLDEPPVVVLLFGSGKIVVTGGTTREVVERAVEVVESRLVDLNLLD
jgi:transcription initiation factor TFIID TATA-box-binding protein